MRGGGNGEVELMWLTIIEGYNMVWGEEGTMQDRGFCLERGRWRVESRACQLSKNT